MKKRLQIALSDEAQGIVDSIVRDAKRNFTTGHISYSDVINEMVITSKLNIKTLQLKNTDVRKTLRQLASGSEVDLDDVLKNLMELKGKVKKSKARALTEGAL